MSTYQPNILPQQQILQANGKQSIDALRMAPNSSALIADSTAPIVWRCMSDSLGNVTAEAFDIIPHKSEEQIAQDNLTMTISNINERLSRLEAQYESTIDRASESEFISIKTNDAKHQKPTGSSKSNDAV